MLGDPTARRRLASTFSIETTAGPRPVARVGAPEELEPALEALAVSRPRPALALVGGAAGLGEDALVRLRPLFVDALCPLAERLGLCVIDGGTDAGVMGLMGRARESRGASFPLLGVVVEALVAGRGASASATDAEAARLEPNHSHFLLVEGSRWGDESPWIAATATAVARELAAATVLVDGGELAWGDAEESVREGRSLVTVEGSGRSADELADALAGRPAGERPSRIAASGLVTAVPAEVDALSSALHGILRPMGG